MGSSKQPDRVHPNWWAYASGVALVLVSVLWLFWRDPAPQAEIVEESPPVSQSTNVGPSTSQGSDHKESNSNLQTSRNTPAQPITELEANARETEEYVSGSTEERLTEQQRALDPAEDGWDTEALSVATNARYKQLAKWLEQPKLPDQARLGQFLTKDFKCSDLRPIDAESIYSDGVVRALRSSPEALQGTEHRGVEGFVQAIASLLEPFGQARPRTVKFKQFRIDPATDQTHTTAYFHAFSSTENGPVEINATWNCEWRTNGNALQLAGVTVEAFEQTSAAIKSPTLFADCTAAVAGGSAAFRERLMVDVASWRRQLPTNLNLQYHGHIGLALGDVNGDGLEDVYLCQPGGLPNALFIHQPDGTVREAAAASGVDILNYTRGALFVDLDNDGDQDLILTVIDQLMFYANDGEGRFTAKAELPFIRGAYSISAADFDNDRDLDVYVCRHRADGHDKGEFPVPYPYYEANNGGQNFFLRNEGDWRFTDVTAEVGLDADNSRFSFASSWEDYDTDGDLDLYVANDFGHNTLYRNEGGKFESVAEKIGLEDAAFGMSVSWGDYNRDGLMDLYVGNMFSAAGNRITFQDQFRPDSQEESRKKYQRTARGNSLFENQGDGTFRDVSTQAGVTQGRWSWASLFADINNDGWEDIIVTNGFVTGDTVDDL